MGLLQELVSELYLEKFTSRPPPAFYNIRNSILVQKRTLDCLDKCLINDAWIFLWLMQEDLSFISVQNMINNHCKLYAMLFHVIYLFYLLFS